MRRISIALSPTLIALPALAQTQQQRDWCQDPANGVTADQTTEGCTALIQSGRGTTSDLAGYDYLDRGHAYEDKGLHDVAIVDENEAIALNPGNARAYLNRGRAHGAKGLQDQAIADNGEAIALYPNDKNAQAGLKRLGAAP